LVVCTTALAQIMSVPGPLAGVGKSVEPEPVLLAFAAVVPLVPATAFVLEPRDPELAPGAAQLQARHAAAAAHQLCAGGRNTIRGNIAYTSSADA
jgi:hypothetical protein